MNCCCCCSKNNIIGICKVRLVSIFMLILNVTLSIEAVNKILKCRSEQRNICGSWIIYTFMAGYICAISIFQDTIDHMSSISNYSSCIKSEEECNPSLKSSFKFNDPNVWLKLSKTIIQYIFFLSYLTRQKHHDYWSNSK